MKSVVATDRGRRRRSTLIRLSRARTARVRIDLGPATFLTFGHVVVYDPCTTLDRDLGLVLNFGLRPTLVNDRGSTFDSVSRAACYVDSANSAAGATDAGEGGAGGGRGGRAAARGPSHRPLLI
ncbi:hypothetical protein EVAR_39116_1 [Eumeta japonica]|uniref:Uncharacterized protein n=1 Tax=Eumeta variegata TaxID=151549 RepID=A0A4C1X3W6_EUMVA|nr:hypothetical protein EVAR_39116_1 [Eumeta japonica]